MNEQVQMLEKGAKLLAALNKKIVFIGGATISLYLDEVSAVDARPTNDIAPGHLSSASKNAGREQLLLSLINSISQ
jgi:hypothetical protein